MNATQRRFRLKQAFEKLATPAMHESVVLLLEECDALRADLERDNAALQERIAALEQALTDTKETKEQHGGGARRKP